MKQRQAMCALYAFMRKTDDIADTPEGRNFLARLNGNTFRQRVLAMPGYELLPVREPGSWAAFLN